MRFRWLFIGVGIFLLSCIAAEGSVIIQQLNSPADLDLSGNIIYAINFGNNGNPNVGGVVFSQDEDYSAITHSVFMEEAVTANIPYGSTPPQTGDVGLTQLLDGMAYTYSTPPHEISIDVEGLFTGTPYLLQFINYEMYNVARNIDTIVEDIVIVTGLNPLAEQGGVVGQGGFVTKYEFMATDTVLNIQFMPHPIGAGINGFVLTEVPEPATLSLFAFGAIALLRRKR